MDGATPNYPSLFFGIPFPELATGYRRLSFLHAACALAQLSSKPVYSLWVMPPLRTSALFCGGGALWCRTLGELSRRPWDLHCRCFGFKHVSSHLSNTQNAHREVSLKSLLLRVLFWLMVPLALFQKWTCTSVLGRGRPCLGRCALRHQASVAAEAHQCMSQVEGQDLSYLMN